MNPSKSLSVTLLIMFFIFVITLGYTLTKINNLEQRISKMENEIKNPSVRVIPVDWRDAELGTGNWCDRHIQSNL
jgi:hypothetical protein